MTHSFKQLTLAECVKNHPDGVALIDSEYIIVDSNIMFQQMTGIKEGSLKLFDSIVHPRFLESWNMGFACFSSNRNSVHRLIIQFERSEIPDRWIRLTFLPGTDTVESYFLILLADITNEKNRELELTQARDKAEDATHSMEEILANTSHEIRTPIHTIMSTLELLNETSMDQEQREYLSGIQFATEVLSTLINDILDFSKIEAGQLRLEKTAFNLIEILEDAIDMITLEAHKKNVDVALYIDPLVPSCIYGDPTRLRQVVINLVNNAVKFTHKGHIALDVDFLSSEKDVSHLRFSVQDSGIGIPYEKQETLFEAFSQADSSTSRHFGGTGLGLFISRNIVTQMGGQLVLTSEPEIGSQFSFELYCTRSNDAGQTLEMSASVLESHRILIVDDNSEVRNRLARTLKFWGASVDEASNAKRALSMMRSVTQGHYDLVLVDQTMPHVDGWQFASEVQADKSIHQPPMILMSMKGGSGTADAKMKLLGWFDAYLTKPIRQSELAGAILRFLKPDLDLEDASDLEELVQSSTEEEEAASTACVLIAEDHAVNRGLLHTILLKNGHEVFEASNGLEALEIMRVESPDLVFMDCQMPVMNGYEATREIRKQGYQGPIIAITASALEEELKKCKKSGMTDLITKPFKRAQILEVLSQYTANGPVPSEPVNILKDQGIAYHHLPVFDFEAAVKTFLGNRNTVLSLLRPQIIKIEKEMQTLQKALGILDWETIRVTAHSIRGGCLNMSMLRFGEAAAQLEDSSSKNNAEACITVFSHLEQEFPMLQDAVNAVLVK